MIKVNVEKLKVGDVIAEDIVDFERKVLLSAGIALTDNSIALLKLWEINEIKLREENDTDDSIRLSLQFDEIIETNNSLFNSLKTSTKDPIVLSSIIREKPLQQYNDMIQKIGQIFADIQNPRNAEILAAISNIICQYVATTPCVLGYTLQRPCKNTPHEYLINHSMSVAIIAAKIANLLGYSLEKIQTIVLGALLHDIGKTKLPDTIANATGFSTPEDETLYQSHIQIGYDLIKSLGLPREVTLIMVQHHEYNDGSGFPMHLKTDKIHPYAHIVGFADMFDTLVHENNELANFFDIRTKLLRNGANKFSEKIIDIFDHYLKDFIFNVNVELTDGRKAEVIYTHPFYMSLVVHTTDGDFVDLGKNKDVYIKKTFL